MKNWQLVETPSSSPAIMDMETQDIIMYIDDMNPELMDKVAQMYNEGSTLERISLYLAPGNADCTQEQHDYVMENLTIYLKLKGMITEKPAESIDSIIARLEPGQTTHQTATKDSTGHDIIVNPNGTVLTQQQRAAITRKENAAKKTAGTPKKAGTAEAIKILEEKIALIKLLDSAEVLDIPTGLGKGPRELMTEFQREQQVLIDSYLEKVQNL